MDKDISGSKYTLCIGYKMRAVKRIAVIHFDKSKCAGAEVGIGSKIFRSHTRRCLIDMFGPKNFLCSRK